MSRPEQLGLFGGEVTEQSDIYSLGLVLAAALRGKPLDMSGSQFEVVEKRRSVPDLGDIDEELRPVIEAMLQPDPEDRPESMAEIARATQPPATAAPERTATTRRGAHQSISPEAAPPAKPAEPLDVPAPIVAKGADGAPFVAHVRPAYLSQPKPSPTATPPKAAPGRPARTRGIAIAATAVAVLAAGTAAYMTGLISLKTDTVEEQRTAVLTPSEDATAGADGSCNAQHAGCGSAGCRGGGANRDATA